MSNPVIRVENLGKRYFIRQPNQAAYQTLRHSLMEGVKSLSHKARSGAGRSTTRQEFWALHQVSFEVQSGEVLGVIGRNGAGKSTLLKLISRITRPTTGKIWLRGQVASLLEVGTGFHPELTGRENIYLNGAILGMSRAEIRRKFDEIIAFAELEKFLDTPVKYYSSGMYMRLAFAVAAHLEPEILLVDEVLAVGDAAFQKKCLGKMGDVAKQGRTVLFVSHNLAAVQSLCGRVIHLQQGRLVEDGSPAEVISNYLSTSFSTQTEQRWPDITTAPGTEAVRLHLARVRPVDGSCRDAIDVTTPFLLEFEFWNLTPGAYLDLSVVLYNEEGIPVFNTMPLYETEWHERPFPFGLFRSVCYIPGDLLNNGIHIVELYVVKDQTVDLYCHSDLLVFEVGRGIERRKFWHNDWLGATRPKLEWRTELLQADLPANSN